MERAARRSGCYRKETGEKGTVVVRSSECRAERASDNIGVRRLIMIFLSWRVRQLIFCAIIFWQASFLCQNRWRLVLMKLNMNYIHKCALSELIGTIMSSRETASPEVGRGDTMSFNNGLISAFWIFPVLSHCEEDLLSRVHHYKERGAKTALPGF